MKVEIYSDIACPWCYIGKSRFERALRDFHGAAEIEVVFRPYQLDPAAPRKAIPMFEYLEGRFGPGARGMTARVVEAARAEGIEMDFERGLLANTLDAHRLLWLVEREKGVEAQRAAAAKLFEAHFSAGRDIGDGEVLAEIGEASGLDGARVRSFLASEEGAAEVEAEIEGARRLGISAVPTFVFDGRYAVQGAQSPAAFLEALRTVASDGD